MKWVCEGSMRGRREICNQQKPRCSYVKPSNLGTREAVKDNKCLHNKSVPRRELPSDRCVRLAERRAANLAACLSACLAGGLVTRLATLTKAWPRTWQRPWQHTRRCVRQHALLRAWRRNGAEHFDVETSTLQPQSTQMYPGKSGKATEGRDEQPRGGIRSTTAQRLQGRDHGGSRCRRWKGVPCCDWGGAWRPPLPNL